MAMQAGRSRQRNEMSNAKKPARLANVARLSKKNQKMASDAAKFRDKVISMVTADPGLPRSNPTPSFWQLPPHHAVSSVQASTLRQETDVVVIGSGITGCSVTKALLEDAEGTFGPVIVTVLEARTLCSGATGRNGGHLVSPMGHKFSDLVAAHGVDNAREMARFSLRNVERVQEMIASLPKHIQEASEIRPVTRIGCVVDEEMWVHHKASVELFERELPERKGHHRLISGKDAKEEYGLLSVVGGIVHKAAAAIWPYRLVTELFHHLLTEFPSRLSIETHTPVTSVTESSETDYPYLLTTPRGCIKAKRVVYCTNAYTAHLLPQLRGKIHPFRGHMTVQDLGPDFPAWGSERSWAVMSPADLDPTSGHFHEGLYYVQQNAKTRDLFIGVENQTIDECLSSDDGFNSQISHKDLLALPARLFAKAADGRQPKLKAEWSGVMGITPDGLPMVGNLPKSITGRSSGQEWIAAAFNGYGMDKTWLSGEAVVAMMAGRDVREWFPSAYVLNEQRLATLVTPEQIAEDYWQMAESTLKRRQASQRLQKTSRL